ncbi:peptidoglycan-binding protein [Bacillus sp. B-jedd]|uniref:peptidoglycan-binding protein n=1 Tax=Bacillus sp. B-jedd TaxID=1476857 RepID=UPI0005156FF7|nr:peptidoglycan-binding protein [Bacillus sp. B-jedd]CEG29782.1 N-acetylmuramoyl-L-alanine amidase [Bacillus sp. B-jedd]
MKIIERFLTKNNCFKAGKKIKVKGLMLHSTGANNPKLSRYIQPDDGILGKNPNNNDWNRPQPDGQQKCVHAFIGKDKNGVVRTYQTLPWNHRGWGGGGKSNDTHIHVEICEDDLKDPKYFKEVYREAVELFAYLCKEFPYLIPDKDIITHSEGYKMGIASNHGDVMHWFPKHGKSMNTFRADVSKALEEEAVLKKGAKGDSVKKLQNELITVGEKLPKFGADGDYGQETENAVKAFQARYSLTVNGIADNVTLNKLAEVLKSKVTSKPVPAQSKPAPAKPAAAPKQFLIRVKANSLYYYTKPDWNAKAAIPVKKGTVLTVVQTLTVAGSKMYKLKSGTYITANPKYVVIVK